jgi:hypothetical protein
MSRHRVMVDSPREVAPVTAAPRPACIFSCAATGVGADAGGSRAPHQHVHEAIVREERRRSVAMV